MSTLAGDHTAVHDYDHVAFLYGSNSLCNDDLGGLRDIFHKTFSDECIRSGIDRRCRVIENEDLRFLKESSGDAESLLLTTGNVGTALLDVCVVSVRELRYEFVCLGDLACGYDLFVSRILVTPAEILGNGAGEQFVLLKHYRYGIS